MDTPDPTPSPLELLQMAQATHEQALRLHRDSLDRHDAILSSHQTQMHLLVDMHASQTRTQQSLRDLHTRLTDNQIAFATTLAQHGSRLTAVEAATLQVADAIGRITSTLEAIKDLLGRSNEH
jgi:hypothetical protein